MSALTGPLLVAATLLVLGGALKLVRPHETALALSTAGIPLGRAGVRALSAVEVVVGVAAAATGAAWAVGCVAVSYAAFTGFVAVALVRRLPLSTCGCLGRPDTPPTRAHVVVNATLAAVAGAVWADGGAPSLASTLSDQPAAGVPFVALVGLATWMAVIVMSDLARLQRALRGERR